MLLLQRYPPLLLMLLLGVIVFIATLLRALSLGGAWWYLSAAGLAMVALAGWQWWLLNGWQESLDRWLRRSSMGQTDAPPAGLEALQALLDQQAAQRSEAASGDDSALRQKEAELEAAFGQKQAQLEQELSQVAQLRQQMEQCQQQLKQAAELAERQLQVTREADAQSHEGNLVITDSIGSIASLTDQVEDVAGEIRQLGEMSQRVNSILATITAITEQTNLLALNAAIEAARAGEHGRGFAVVADEVRGLAGKARQSATEIGEIINDLVSQVQSAVNTTDVAHRKVEEVDEKITDAAMTYAELVAQLKKLAALAGELAETTRATPSAEPAD